MNNFYKILNYIDKFINDELSKPTAFTLLPFFCYFLFLIYFYDEILYLNLCNILHYAFYQFLDIRIFIWYFLIAFIQITYMIYLYLRQYYDFFDIVSFAQAYSLLKYFYVDRSNSSVLVKYLYFRSWLIRLRKLSIMYKYVLSRPSNFFVYILYTLVYYICFNFVFDEILMYNLHNIIDIWYIGPSDKRFFIFLFFITFIFYIILIIDDFFKLDLYHWKIFFKYLLLFFLSPIVLFVIFIEIFFYNYKINRTFILNEIVLHPYVFIIIKTIFLLLLSSLSFLNTSFRNFFLKNFYYTNIEELKNKIKSKEDTIILFLVYIIMLNLLLVVSCSLLIKAVIVETFIGISIFWFIILFERDQKDPEGTFVLKKKFHPIRDEILSYVNFFWYVMQVIADYFNMELDELIENIKYIVLFCLCIYLTYLSLINAFLVLDFIKRLFNGLFLIANL